ncbi:MAG: hypothetical protein H0V82_05250 [Candidatus Protochlamydia sp.]|nr:hypothetical protein [Candidatus Protochlamydia sp.]
MIKKNLAVYIKVFYWNGDLNAKQSNAERVMLKTFAKIFGVIMTVVGLLGFVPQATPDGMLLGIFHVNGVI